MSETTESIMLEILKNLQSGQNIIKEDVHDIKTRITSLERSVAGLFTDQMEQHARFDKMNDRISRIEKRLEINE